MFRRRRLGYVLAALAAIISGVIVYVNSLGVQSVADPILYTTLKDGVVGLALLLPLAASRSRRAEYRRLDRRDVGLDGRAGADRWKRPIRPLLHWPPDGQRRYCCPAGGFG